MSLTNLQYNEIQRIYEQRQLRTHNEMNARYWNVCQRIPEYGRIKDSISELCIKQARKLLEGDTRALDDLKKQIKALSEKADSLLVSGGFPADYLEPVYVCNDCRDTGYIGSKKCHCFHKAVTDILYTQSNIKDILQSENFGTFSFDYYSDNFIDPKTGKSSLASIRYAYDAAVKFVKDFGKEFQNLLLYGDSGVGKTFLSHCIAKELIDRSRSVLYFSSFELFDIFSKCSFKNDETASRINEQVFSCDLLIIDDLGTELPNSFTVSKLFLCLNERMINRKPTIISTNLSPDTLGDIYTQRTFSRIMSNYSLLKLTGDDIRIQKTLRRQEAHT